MHEYANLGRNLLVRPLPGNGEWWMDAHEDMGHGEEVRTSRKSKRKERKNTAGFVILDILTHTKQLRLPCVMQSDFFFPISFFFSPQW